MGPRVPVPSLPLQPPVRKQDFLGATAECWLLPPHLSLPKGLSSEQPAGSGHSWTQELSVLMKPPGKGRSPGPGRRKHGLPGSAMNSWVSLATPCPGKQGKEGEHKEPQVCSRAAALGQ